MCPIIGYNGTNIVPIIGQISRVDLYVFLCKRCKKTTIEPVVKEEDNPDYGTYYYADGDRRQDVMEVNFGLYGNIV